MKKILLTAIIVLTTINSFAKSLTEQDKSGINQNTENEIINFTYRLFPTQNMWAFIKLNSYF